MPQQIETLEHWVDANVNTMSGGGKAKAPKQTKEKVKYNGRMRIVFIGARGGKYVRSVKKNGDVKYISITK